MTPSELAASFEECMRLSPSGPVTSQKPQQRESMTLPIRGLSGRVEKQLNPLESSGQGTLTVKSDAHAQVHDADHIEKFSPLWAVFKHVEVWKDWFRGREVRPGEEVAKQTVRVLDLFAEERILEQEVKEQQRKETLFRLFETIDFSVQPMHECEGCHHVILFHRYLCSECGRYNLCRSCFGDLVLTFKHPCGHEEDLKASEDVTKKQQSVA
ncbi:hypothetical protein WHR41_03537 [Cladosporium halotolerans]|uniref:Uncharacterized protein n=1 Tax=Cladosporium halotolerans TaxID=1052096 RepID=A0AB34KRZ1_9PEZI